jgi:hypothetical protein
VTENLMHFNFLILHAQRAKFIDFMHMHKAPN